MLFLANCGKYDIETDNWHTQRSTALNGIFPKARVDFCMVGISAPDNSSHQLYVFGGAPEVRGSDSASLDDVWNLTMPSFQWVRASGPPPRGGLESLVCQPVAKRYMVSYQGRPGYYGQICHETTGINLFDMTTLSWTTNFVAETPNSTYRTPQAIYSLIGGDASGGANLTSPVSNFDSDALAKLFADKSLNTTQPSTISNITTNAIGDAKR
ncbi:hypothetical protein RUND412_003425 [Rhizina undulata]